MYSSTHLNVQSVINFIALTISYETFTSIVIESSSFKFRELGSSLCFINSWHRTFFILIWTYLASKFWVQVVIKVNRENPLFFVFLGQFILVKHSKATYEYRMLVPSWFLMYPSRYTQKRIATNMVSNIHSTLQADLQTAAQRLPLVKKSTGSVSQLDPQQSIDDILSHEITEIGTHM